MKELLFCKACRHTTMQVIVEDTGDVEITCATCRKKVLGFESEDNFLDVLKEMHVIHKSIEDEYLGVN